MLLLLLVTVITTAGGVGVAVFTYPPRSRWHSVLFPFMRAALLLMLLLLHCPLSLCLLIFHSLNSKYTHCVLSMSTHLHTSLFTIHIHMFCFVHYSSSPVAAQTSRSAKNQFQRQQRAKHIKNILMLISVLIISMNF